MKNKSNNKLSSSNFAVIDCSTGQARASVSGLYVDADAANMARVRLGGFACAVEFADPVELNQRIWKNSVINIIGGELR